MNHPKFSEIDFTNLKPSLGGGMVVQEAVATNCKTTDAVYSYGLTEAAPAVCINPLHISDFNGSIGVPLPSTLVSIRDKKNEMDLCG